MSSSKNNPAFTPRSGSTPAMAQGPHEEAKKLLAINSSYITKFQDINISVITWNVASVKPHPMVIEEIRKSFKCGDQKADAIFIALQEIDMGLVSIMVGSTEVSNKWSKIIGEAVNQENGEFIVMSERTLGGVYAAVIVKKDAVPRLEVHLVKTIRLGVYGMAANKGAAIFYCTLSCARFIVIACHLSPHTENLQQRNEQVRQLLKVVQGSYDYLIFVGDLNYRIALSYEETCKLIEEGNIKRLLESDQLRNTMKNDKLIGSLKEPPLIFNPTYKFDKNCNIYDTSSKHRVPSWTDRILIKRGPRRLAVGNSKKIATDPNDQQGRNFPKMPKIIAFRKGECMFSDHRSVTASYIFQVPVIDPQRLEEVKTAIGYEDDEQSQSTSNKKASGFVKMNSLDTYESNVKQVQPNHQFSVDTYDPFADMDIPAIKPIDEPLECPPASNPGMADIFGKSSPTKQTPETKPSNTNNNNNFDIFGFNIPPQAPSQPAGSQDMPLIVFDFVDSPAQPAAAPVTQSPVTSTNPFDSFDNFATYPTPSKPAPLVPQQQAPKQQTPQQQAPKPQAPQQQTNQPKNGELFSLF